jgi:hypothetical protein
MGDAPEIRLVAPEAALASTEPTLVEVVDRLLDAGVVIRGEVWLTVADVDLVFLGADILLASPDRMRRDRAPAKSPARERQS